MTYHTLRIALTLATLTIAPSLATAGPIGWSYTAHVRTTSGLGVLNLGVHRPDTDPSGTGEPVSVDYVTTAPLPEARMSGEYSPHDWPPSGANRLFSVGSGYSVDPAATAPASDAAFRLSFTLTDQVSGQAATIDYDGSVKAYWNGGSSPAVLFIGYFHDETRSVTLGSKRYQVTAFGGTTGEFREPAMMGVDVLATAVTPEPATLAMAGIGLAGVGLFRRGRRAVQDSGR